MTSRTGPQLPVVVGVDGSDEALTAARWAAREAALRGAALRVVHAYGWLPVDEADQLTLTDDVYAVLARAARARLATAVATARDEAPGVSVDGVLMPDYAVPRLVEETGAAQLVVVGHGRQRGLTGVLAGSTALSVSTHARCPVVVVRGDQALPSGSAADRPVVVGVDGSPLSEAAIPFAFEAAALRGAPLVAVHTWADTSADLSVWPLIDWAAVEVEEQALLAERLAGWSAKFPDITVRRVVRRDRPAAALLEVAAAAQLVVVGSRGRGGFRGLLLGSVGTALIHHGPCPVAIVRPDSGTDR
ncbi:universal stress protein [Actinomycetes bacterium KLBMP 9759]